MGAGSMGAGVDIDIRGRTEGKDGGFILSILTNIEPLCIYLSTHVTPHVRDMWYHMFDLNNIVAQGQKI